MPNSGHKKLTKLGRYHYVGQQNDYQSKGSSMPKSKDDIPDYTVDFLLKELEIISNDIARFRSEGINRLNFFISMTTAILGGLAFLFSMTTYDIFQFALAGGFFLLILIGWNAFQYLIERDIASDRNARATARIRRFFLDKFPVLEKHITWHMYDDPTSWVTANKSNMRKTVQYILSAIIAILSGVIASNLIAMMYISILIAIIFIPLTFFVLEMYAKLKFKKATNEAISSIRFPKPTQNK